MKAILILIVALLLSGCVAMDVSNLETAEPLRKGKMRIGINSGLGMDLTKMVENESEELVVDDLPVAAISGFQMQYGLTGDLDLGGRVWTGGSSTGFTAYLKKTLSQNGEGKSVAFAPGLSVGRSEGVYSEDGDQSSDWYTAAEASARVMLTQRWSRGAAGTVGARVGLAYYDGDSGSAQEESSPEFLVHSGISLNLKLSMGPFYIIPEIGGEFYNNAKGYSGVVPFYMIGLGFE